MEIRRLTLKDPAYPAVLRNIPTPPQQLFVQGELDPLLARPRLGVVGSRKVSPYGYHVTRDLVRELVKYDVVIVSGLALGVDGVAHQAALDAGGQTIAVVGGGLDQITPRTNKPLAEKLLHRQGAIVTEYPLGQKAFRFSFVARNRIIAGLSDVLLVTEASIASGTRHTVDAANDQGKTVMAIPGNIDSLQAAGTNKLLKDGALLVTEAADILQELGLNHEKPVQTKLFGDTEEETMILQLISKGVYRTSGLIEASGLNVIQLNQCLTILEVAGKIHYAGGSSWQLS